MNKFIIAHDVDDDHIVLINTDRIIDIDIDSETKQATITMTEDRYITIAASAEQIKELLCIN